MASKPIPIPSKNPGVSLDQEAQRLQNRLQSELDHDFPVGSPNSAQENLEARRAALIAAANKLAHALSLFSDHDSSELPDAIAHAKRVLGED